MKKTLLVAVAGAAIIGAGFYLTQPQTLPPVEAPAEGEAMVDVTLPATLSQEAMVGHRAFDAVCADCHGANAAGKMGFGPPLVHKIYEPSHHADMSFVLAVQNGVRAHHWQFGDMPAQSGLTQADVAGIITYVRELQRANGID
ncbi:c-type cytochrome [Pseudooceanicola sp. MF1-13]|uniref:c-type cytochrome n=1 Tax=Pseudooceanicola sp. MF1-13 TaxID=3379095 RepID=UPI0038928FC8